MTDNEALRKTREWWDNRAATVADLPDVVAVGRYDLEPATMAFIEKTVANMLGKARGKDLCMDGGCGVGLAFPIIQRVFPHIVGVDFSPVVIRRIPGEYPASGNVSLCNGSITTIPLRSECLDAVHCRELVQCLPATEIRRMFEEFRRVLKPGGVAVVHCRNSNNLLHRLAKAAGRIKRFGRAIPDVDPIASEHYVPGDTYLRAWRWYVTQAELAGLKVERQFSWQMFFWGRLQKHGLARRFERLERALRRSRITEPLIRHDGINYYLLLRKPG